ncbi:sigma-70 family RNA polymerase sigma factor [bacterium]|nr:sigma-70 family RNA polymerase sigma factor [bacterium]
MLDRTAATPEREGAPEARLEKAEGEARLIARARSGEAAAFEEIVRVHSDAVFRVVAGHLGSSEAEDASQEVFLQVHRGLRAFEGRSLLSTWIFRIATNVALKRLRRKRRRPSSRSIEEGEAVAADGPAPEAGLDSSELRAVLLRALDRLPEEQRAVVVLRGIEGLPFEEVARVLGIVRPTAESRMARAKEKLRSLLRPWISPEARDQG